MKILQGKWVKKMLFAKKDPREAKLVPVPLSQMMMIVIIWKPMMNKDGDLSILSTLLILVVILFILVVCVFFVFTKIPFYDNTKIITLKLFKNHFLNILWKTN